MWWGGRYLGCSVHSYFHLKPNSCLDWCCVVVMLGLPTNMYGGQRWKKSKVFLPIWWLGLKLSTKTKESEKIAFCPWMDFRATVRKITNFLNMKVPSYSNNLDFHCNFWKLWKSGSKICPFSKNTINIISFTLPPNRLLLFSRPSFILEGAPHIFISSLYLLIEFLRSSCFNGR